MVCRLMILSCCVAGLAVAVSRQASAKPYATAKAADDSVTWAMNAEPPPLVGSIELQRVLASQIN